MLRRNISHKEHCLGGSSSGSPTRKSPTDEKDTAIEIAKEPRKGSLELGRSGALKENGRRIFKS